MTAPLAQPQPRPRAGRHPQQAEPRPRLRLVSPADLVVPERTQRARRIGLILTGLIAAVLFGVVSAHALLTQGQLQLEQLSSRAAEAEARFQRLRLQVAELESPQRVVAVAQQRLGMVPPPGVTYLSPTGTTAGELARSTPPPATKPAPSAPDHGAWAAVKAQLDGRP